jgi:NADH-quinone oxidoreductase subunit N
MNWSLILTSMLPEHLLLVGMLAILGLEIRSGRPRDGFAFAVLFVAAAAAAALWLYATGFAGAPFLHHFSVGPATSLPKAVLLALAVPVLLISRDDFAETPYYTLVLASLYGACLVISSDSFPTLFLGIEIMSLPVYALVVLGMLRAQSAEAALKYLVLGGTATASLLLGISFLYGWSSSLQIAAFSWALGSADPLALAGVALVTAALFLKAAIVPFHAWAPDAYEGASAPVTAYMATIIKAGVLLAALRVFGTTPVLPPVVGLIAILPLVSMAWGNLAAIRQASVRRMIAYSSIAHAGYLFFALLGDGRGRWEAIVFYLLAYGLMNVLVFAALPRGADDERQDRLDTLKGLYRRRPFAAIMIATAMLSLAGLPPLPGFVAKFLVFKNVLAAGYTGYAVAGLVASYLGLYFYLRVIQYMFMAEEEPGAARGSPRRYVVAASLLCLVPAVLLMLFPGWLIDRL